MTARYLLLILALISLDVSADAMSTKLLSCSAIDAPLERLACFDKIVTGLSTSVTAPGPAAEAMQEPLPVATASQLESTDSAAGNQQFGQEHWESQREGMQLEARVSAAYKNAYGKWVVTLDNGQVWKQLRSETIRISVDDNVLIERGLMNSFFFRLNDNDRQIKFSRVK